MKPDIPRLYEHKRFPAKKRTRGFTPYRGSTPFAFRRRNAQGPVKPSRGFTLVELLVVISIISLLSSVVFASVNSARAKARDAVIKSQLSMMRTSAALAYDLTGTFDTVCDDTSDSGRQMRNAFEKSNKGNSESACLASNTTGFISNGGILATAPKPVTPDKWAASIFLLSGKFFCVDYLGTAQEQAGRGIDNSPLDVEC